MQHKVILVLATMLAIVAVVLVFLLWRAYRRSAWRQRWQAVGTMGWTRAPSRSSDPPAAPQAHPPAPVLPLSGKDESSGRTLRATLYGAGTATAATLHR
jgi:hypothetical protein